MKRTKQEKAITLIALIITIIVLLILAIVTINAIQGDDGLITKANNAAKKYKDAASEENSLIQSYLAKMPEENGTGGNNGGGTPSTYVGATGITVAGVSSVAYSELTGEIKTAADAGTIVAVVKEGTNIAPIPSGFSVSTEESEQKISTGLVVKDSAGNEFVWVPVSNISEMAKLQSGSETNYEGILYKFSGTTATERTYYGIGTTEYREPDTLSDTKYADGNTTYLSTVGCTTIEEFKAQMQTEFNKMVASVSKYKGFYVARYELSTTSEGKLASKAGTTVTTAETNRNRWYGLYNICKTYNVTSSVESNMIYGCQYDAMMRWMQSAGINVTSTNITGVSYNSNSSTTGQSGDTDKLNNVYDLLGGRLEWTQEAGRTNGRVNRGGAYGSGDAASSHDYDNPSSTASYHSARATLCIK